MTTEADDLRDIELKTIFSTHCKNELVKRAKELYDAQEAFVSDATAAARVAAANVLFWAAYQRLNAAEGRVVSALRHRTGRMPQLDVYPTDPAAAQRLINAALADGRQAEARSHGRP